MPGSGIESASTSSNATDEEEVLQFDCKKCGQRCTAAEKDAHRAMHSRQKRKRAPSPDESEAPTLFQQVPVPEAQKNVAAAENLGPVTRRSGAVEMATTKAEKRAESGKRRSIKHYNKNVKAIRCKGV